MRVQNPSATLLRGNPGHFLLDSIPLKLCAKVDAWNQCVAGNYRPALKSAVLIPSFRNASNVA